MRIRNQILYKKHDPHKIEKLKEGQVYEPPPPPPPPFKSSLTLFQESLSYNNNNNKNKSNDDYEESPEPTEGIVNTIYKTNGDSGFSDLNQIQCEVNNSEVQRPINDALRPNSQASDDSDDSGFRSSRSGQYTHSATDSAGNPHELYPHGAVSSCQVHDTVPLFKPIKIHPNEFGQPHVSYIHRSSSASKYRNHRLNRKAPVSSPIYNTGSESQNINQLNSIYNVEQPIGFPQIQHRNSVPPNFRHNCNTRHVSLSNYDVNGGRLHSIDSHYGPLASPGHYGSRPTLDKCGHHHGFFADGLIQRTDSIGYGSVCNSSLGYMPNVGQPGGPNQPIPNEHLCQPPQTSHFPTQSSFPLSATIPGYTISQNTHMRPIQPEVSVHKMNEPLQTVPEASIPLTVTQAMVHRPYVEELSDPSLYSVV